MSGQCIVIVCQVTSNGRSLALTDDEGAPAMIIDLAEARRLRVGHPLAGAAWLLVDTSRGVARWVP